MEKENLFMDLSGNIFNIKDTFQQINRKIRKYITFKCKYNTGTSDNKLVYNG